MSRRLPLLLGLAAAAAVLLLVGPIAIAMALLRSSAQSEGPHLAAQIFIAVFVLAAAAAAGVIAWGLTRLVLRLLGRGR
jgi:small neutral amino acid transporter SnatA (MarC family)